MTNAELAIRRARRRFPPRLRPGEVIRLDPDPKAPEYRVVRVNECAAYVKRRVAEGKIVEIPGRKPFKAHEDGGLLAISPTAFVFRAVG